MRPYFEEDGITIYHGDCREVLPSLAARASVVTDPPYGIDNDPDLQRFSGGITRRGGGWRKHDRIIGDDKPFNPSHLLEFKNLIVWGANHFWNDLPRGGCLVWVKRNEYAFGTFLSDAEIAFVSGIQGVYCFKRVFAGSQKAMDAGFDAYAQSAHPNQKPVELMNWCLGFTEGDVIDPYMGSGTTLVSAKRSGRRAIGIEIEEKYCEVSARRLQQSVFRFEDRHVEADKRTAQGVLAPMESQASSVHPKTLR